MNRLLVLAAVALVMTFSVSAIPAGPPAAAPGAPTAAPGAPAGPPAAAPGAPTAAPGAPTAAPSGAPAAPAAPSAPPTAPPSSPGVTGSNNFKFNIALDSTASQANGAKTAIQEQCVKDLKAKGCVVGTFAGKKFNTLATSTTLDVTGSALSADQAKTVLLGPGYKLIYTVTSATVVTSPSSPSAAVSVSFSQWMVGALVLVASAVMMF